MCRKDVVVRCLGKPIAIMRVVLVGEERRLPVVAALDDVKDQIGKELARAASHGERLRVAVELQQYRGGRKILL